MSKQGFVSSNPEKTYCRKSSWFSSFRWSSLIKICLGNTFGFLQFPFVLVYVALEVKLQELSSSLRWCLGTTQTNSKENGCPVNQNNLQTIVWALPTKHCDCMHTHRYWYQRKSKFFEAFLGAVDICSIASNRSLDTPYEVSATPEARISANGQMFPQSSCGSRTSNRWLQSEAHALIKWSSIKHENHPDQKGEGHLNNQEGVPVLLDCVA